VGLEVGFFVGAVLGYIEGFVDCISFGDNVSISVGEVVGSWEGVLVRFKIVEFVGYQVGDVGISSGCVLGYWFGLGDGETVGLVDGGSVGILVRLAVGKFAAQVGISVCC
jgi:hypothetical protein